MFKRNSYSLLLIALAVPAFAAERITGLPTTAGLSQPMGTAAPAVSLSVFPPNADIVGGGKQQFQATVTGSTNTAVDWSIIPATAGTISSTGLYTAPATISTGATVVVIAVSRANPAKSVPVPVRLHGSGIYFTTQQNGLQSIMYRGVDYNYKYGENLVSYLIFATPTGPSSTVAPVCSGTNTDTTVTKKCFVGSDSANMSITYSTPSPDTVQATIQITNNSASNTITDSLISTLGVHTSQFDAANSRILYVDNLNPVSYGRYPGGQWIVWNNQPSSDVTVAVTCGWNSVCKNQPHLRNIAPGQTKTVTLSLRFSTDPSITPNLLAPEAYTAFRAAYPPLVNWPDRRPIMAWFIADYGKRSPTNTRGYLQQPNLDVSNIANFKTQVMNQAQHILTMIKARPIQPQGLLIWDLEGQEFIQPTTYMGDPRVFSKGYAPEMDAVADQLFALFKSNGYKVGVTLRPQQLQFGTQLPATCHFNAINDYKDYFIKTDNPYNQRFYACYDPAGSKWSVIPQGNGGQTFFTPAQESSVTDLLMSKVTYAHSRWGATLFYVDTAVWTGGAPLPPSIFITLQKAFPDCLFIPEQSSITTMSAAMPYSDPKNTNAPKFAPASWRYVYPNGALGVYLANCVGTCWTDNVNSFNSGQLVGDIAMYTQPTQMSTAQLTTIEGMIQKARSDASSVTVTDSTNNATYAYRGFPDTVYHYPVKMRVYFAASPAQAAASTTYCEAGGLLGETSCTLKLAGLTTAQIRYYDFAGNLVITNNPQPR